MNFITDNPSNNFENMMNFAYAKDGEVYFRYANGEDEVKLQDYIKSSAMEEKNCECNIDDCFMDCDCIYSLLYVVATQAAELRGKLKKYEEEYSAIHWNKVTTRPLTDEEKEYYSDLGYEGVESIFDCEMPDDGEEILIATNYGVDKDVCCDDGYHGIGLECHDDWDNVIAWAKMPEYKDGAE